LRTGAKTRNQMRLKGRGGSQVGGGGGKVGARTCEQRGKMGGDGHLVRKPGTVSPQDLERDLRTRRQCARGTCHERKGAPGLWVINFLKRDKILHRLIEVVPSIPRKNNVGSWLIKEKTFTAIREGRPGGHLRGLATFRPRVGLD